MMTNGNNWGKYGPRLVLLGPGMLLFYSGPGGTPVTVPDRGVVVGGGVRNAVAQGEVRQAVAGGGLRQAVVGRGVPGAE